MSKQNKHPHPHAALIKAWADGATIQFYDEEYNKWFDCAHGTPSWHKTTLYRIKPEEPKQSIPEGLSEGEKALIKAAREVRINHISEGGETTYSCVVTYDEKIVNAFRQIQAEQEAKA